MATLICAKIVFGGPDIITIELLWKHFIKCKEFMIKAGWTAYMKKSLTDLTFCLGH